MTHLQESNLLAAQMALRELEKEMGTDFQQFGSTWPRDWMQKHINERHCLIRAQTIILDAVEKSHGGNAKPGQEPKV